VARAERKKVAQGPRGLFLLRSCPIVQTTVVSVLAALVTKLWKFDAASRCYGVWFAKGGDLQSGVISNAAATNK